MPMESSKPSSPSITPGELPITPLRNNDGEWVRVNITRPDYTIWLRAWEAKIGCVTLYLLDTNDPANDPVVRLIGSELYGGGPQLRLRQEIILGIGGWRLLRELGMEPAVCHLNEGHAAFAVLERARCFMQDNSVDFHTALAATRAGMSSPRTLRLQPGFDRFSPAVNGITPEAICRRIPPHSIQRIAGARTEESENNMSHSIWPILP